MKAIWKFDPGQECSMPEGARILHVAKQLDDVCIWALVDPAASVETRRFVIRGTGHLIDPRLEYVGTWQDTPFVWHLFEERSK